MAIQSTIREEAVEEFLGDIAPLAAQIGSTEGLATLSAGAPGDSGRVTDLPSLRRFLCEYQSRILLALELPAILRAHGHAGRYEIRELIELDRHLADQPLLQSFATASHRVGKTQLKRLRPLRDQRIVQRYLRAVQAGEANAWHTLVYGLMLSLYSVPLRQGLVNYALRTTRGFVWSAAATLNLTGERCAALADEVSDGLPGAVNRLVDHSTPKQLIA